MTKTMLFKKIGEEVVLPIRSFDVILFLTIGFVHEV